MRAFTEIVSLVAPLNRTNVDTDAIIPKQFLKSIKRTGFGVNLFDEWRYLDAGVPEQDCTHRPRNPRFSLNQERYIGAQILLAGENFGCGSSREHAAWALLEFGFRALVAPSFGDIFYTNCFKNGLLPVVLCHDIVERLFLEVEATPGFNLRVDLRSQAVTTPAGERFEFEVAAGNKSRMLEGLDEIGLTLKAGAQIRDYEVRRREQEPWLFPNSLPD
jgi:3-isopropylmalate/(R)-2-methylmalate dehydratase small subunit